MEWLDSSSSPARRLDLRTAPTKRKRDATHSSKNALATTPNFLGDIERGLSSLDHPNGCSPAEFFLQCRNHRVGHDSMRFQARMVVATKAVAGCLGSEFDIVNVCIASF